MYVPTCAWCVQKLELGEPDWRARSLALILLTVLERLPERMDPSLLCLHLGAFLAVLITREFAIRWVEQPGARGMHSKGKEEGTEPISLAFTLLCALHWVLGVQLIYPSTYVGQGSWLQATENSG